MERMQPSHPSTADRRATAETFGRWLRDRMIERDYNLSARGGGQRRLAEQTGLSAATVSRLLNGEALSPDPDGLRRIAEALALPFGSVLIRAGVLTVDELRDIQTAASSDRPPLTEERAAAGLGIDDPVAMELYKAGVAAARDLQAKRLRKRAE